MYQLIVSQENLLVLSFSTGVLMGVSYDVLRGIRRIVRHNYLFVFAEDVLYWIFWTTALIFFIQKYNSGVIRLYIFATIGVGVVLYLLTISRLYLYVLSKIIYGTKKITRKINKMLKSVVKRVNMRINCRKASKD